MSQTLVVFCDSSGKSRLALQIRIDGERRNHVLEGIGVIALVELDHHPAGERTEMARFDRQDLGDVGEGSRRNCSSIVVERFARWFQPSA